MANYAVVDYVTPKQNSVNDVTALLETYIETIDSTTNAIIEMGVVAVGGEFVGWVIHNG